MQRFIGFIVSSVLVLLASSCQPVEKKITVLTTTDVHGAFFPSDAITGQTLPGSLAHISKYVNEQREKTDHEVLLLDNGDIIQGDPSVYYYNFENTEQVHLFTRAMHYLGYDAATIGNHDIEAGHPVYDRIRNGMQIPWLAANCIDKETGKPYFTPYSIIRKGKIKIAVLGLITPRIPDWLPENIWSGMRFDDMIQSAAYWVPFIREEEKPDILIGLFHAGLDYTYNQQDETTLKNENAVRLVARQVHGFDIIFAGHDHKTWNEYEIDPEGDSVLILGSSSKAKELAQASIILQKHGRKWDVKKRSGTIISMKEIEPDQAFVDHFSEDIQEIKSYVNLDLGHLSTPLSTSEAFFGPSAFMSFIHQVQLDLSGADLSFAAPLSFNTHMEPGVIKMNDLFDLYRFENLLYTMKLSGQEILDYLNYSYGLWFNHMQNPSDHLLQLVQNQNGRFSTASAYYNFDSAQGIDYRVDISKPIGNMLSIEQFTSGEPFDVDSEYMVAINSYRGNGGGGHLVRGAGISESELSTRLVKSTDKDLRFYMKKWITDRGNIEITTIENWKVVPENLARAGATKDYNILFKN
jgi:2',3'-cyclic-nucleotide 2'-phosphodiesterase / 3'-nucleotidase